MVHVKYITSILNISCKGESLVKPLGVYVSSTPWASVGLSLQYIIIIKSVGKQTGNS